LTNRPSFFAELKWRNVYKVAITYAVVVWLLIQAASILFPTFEAPSRVMKAFVVFLAFGFVISVMISWAFEATPEGLKRTEDVSPDVSAKLPTWTHRRKEPWLGKAGRSEQASMRAIVWRITSRTRVGPAPRRSALREIVQSQAPKELK
jgi:hypothetical protein